MADFISFLEDNAISDLEKANKQLLTLVDNIDKVSAKSKNFITPSGADSALKELTAQYKEQEKTIASLQVKLQKASEQNVKNIERQRLAEIKLAQNREKAFDKFEKQAQREQAKLEASENLYNKVQMKLNSLSNEYKNLATRKELGLKLTADEEKNYTRLQSRIQTYDKALKGVDATMGKHQRKVGDYSSAFDPLQNSITQLARETPAFANSLQTGFMAISNNLPVFFDAMGNVIAQNKQLQAEGKPTESVLKQLAGSLFSFQTLLSVGVTLLTVYGKEMVNWVSTLWGASEALEALNKDQKEFSKSRIEGQKEAIKDIKTLNEYVNVMRNSNLSMRERKIALDAVRSSSGGYFKFLSDQQMLEGNITKELGAYKIALHNVQILEKQRETTINATKRLVDLKEELRLTEEKLKVDKKSYDQSLKNNQINIGGSTLVGTGKSTQQIIEERYQATLAKRTKLQQDIAKYNEFIKQSTNSEIELKSKVIILEEKLDKQQKDKITKLKEIRDLEISKADFEKSDYEYQKMILENLISNNKKIADSSKETEEERLASYARYVEAKKKLAQLEHKHAVETTEKEYSEQKEIINKAYNEQINQISTALKEGTTTQLIAKEKRNQALEEKEKALVSLEKKVIIDRNKNTEAFVQREKELADEWNENVPEKIITALKKLKANGKFSTEELEATKRYLEVIKEVTISSNFNKIERDKNNDLEKIKLDRLNFERNELVQKQINLGIEKENSEEWVSIQNEIIAKDKEILNEQVKNAEIRAQIAKKNQEYIKGFINEFGDNSGFSKLFDLIDNFEQLKESGTATALAISEAFQQAFNTINEMSNQRFEVAFANLEKEKDVAIQFAGDSTTAKQEIERQYDERRKRLERQQLQQKKKMAIFNAIMDTAQGVVSAISRVDLYPYNFVLAGLIGALGAVQIASISNQQIPAYAEGTENHKGGLMLVNDGRGSNYKETIITPDGKITQPTERNVLMNAPKGTKVFTHEQWQSQLGNILTKNNIDSPINNNVVAPVVNVETKDNYHFEVNEAGFKTFIKRGQARTEILNGRFRQQKRNY